MVSDFDRRRLFAALEAQLGPGPATTLMDLLPRDLDDLARRSDLVAIRGEMAEIRGEMAEIRGEMAEIRGEMAEIRGEIGEVRAEMKGQVARFVAANVPIMFATAGLVLAAAKLA